MWLPGSLPASLSDLMARLRELLRSSASSWLGLGLGLGLELGLGLLKDKQKS